MTWIDMLLLRRLMNKQSRVLSSSNHSAKSSNPISVTLENLQETFDGVHDAIAQNVASGSVDVSLFYIKSLIDEKQLQSNIIAPLMLTPQQSLKNGVVSSEIRHVDSLEEAIEHVLQGFVVIFAGSQVLSADVTSTLGRSIETSEEETIIYGPKDSLSELLEQNLTLVRRRLPTPNLKSRVYNVGSLSKTSAAVLHIDGITNPKFVDIAFEKMSQIDYDVFFDSSHVISFLEDHVNSIFPQFQQTDRPDAIAAALASGKIVWLIDNSPFALIAPVTFFDLFQSPEDYIHRWIVGTFLRMLRFFAYLLAIILTPLYVAMTTHHYYSIPLDILTVLMESRSGIPFSPLWEAFFMMLVLEILKEASLRMPTKSGQTLGIVGGIVIGQAAVDAGIASNIMIIHIAISAIASFLVPNYIMTDSGKIIQFALLFLAAWLGMWGVIFGLVCILIHLNNLTSLKQPYLAPLTPLFLKDWKDMLVRLPLRIMYERPARLQTVNRMRKGGKQP